MSGARDSMTTGIRALPNGSGPAEKGLRLGLRQGRPASRLGRRPARVQRLRPVRRAASAQAGNDRRVRATESKTESKSAARPLRQCEKEGNGRRDAPAGGRSGRASNRAGQCEVSLSEHRPSGRADMIDRTGPRLLFQARSLPIRAFAPPGAAARGSAERVGRLPTASGREPGRRLAFPLRLPYMPRHSTGGFYAAPDSRRRSGGEVPSLHMIRRGSTGQG